MSRSSQRKKQADNSMSDNLVGEMSGAEQLNAPVLLLMVEKMMERDNCRLMRQEGRLKCKHGQWNWKQKFLGMRKRIKSQKKGEESKCCQV